VFTSALRRGLRDQGVIKAGGTARRIHATPNQRDAESARRRISATPDQRRGNSAAREQRSYELVRRVHLGDAGGADPLEADAAVDPGHLLARGGEEDELGAVVECVPGQQCADGGAESATPR
jgi:hypothetical protein